jgi:recombination associated protein RdgC
MLIKQAQIFQLTDLDKLLEDLEEKLEKLEFTPCAPSTPISIGWISPLEEFPDEEESDHFMYKIDSYIILCLKIEEKILPNTVVQQELKDQVKQIEYLENRKVGQKEKFILKVQITAKLLPKAFSQFTKIYAYIDLKKERLILGTVNTKKTAQFISLFKKILLEELHPFDEINTLSNIMTEWLENQDCPAEFSIEKNCVLQDPNNQMRMIRCQQQDLLSPNIQALIKDGYKIKQLALNWQDQIDFILTNRLLLNSVRFTDQFLEQVKVVDIEPKQQFYSNFLIMAEALSRLLKDLLGVVVTKQTKKLTDNVKVV